MISGICNSCLTAAPNRYVQLICLYKGEESEQGLRGAQGLSTELFSSDSLHADSDLHECEEQDY